MKPTIVARLFGWLRRKDKAPALLAPGHYEPLRPLPRAPRPPARPHTPAARVNRAPYNRFTGHNTPPPMVMPSTVNAADPLEQWWLSESERVCAEGYARMSTTMVSGQGGDFAGGGASGSWEDSRTSTCSADTADHGSSTNDSCSANDSSTTSSTE